MYEVIEYYEPLSKSSATCYERGQIWWTCFPYIFEHTTVTRFWPNKPYQKLDVKRFDPRREKRDDRAQTEPNEFLAITRFKRRPVITLSAVGTSYVDRAWKGEDLFLVAPVRTLRDSLSGEYKANPRFVWSTIRYLFSPVFYLPRSTTHDVRESVLHFDRMITLHRSWLLEPHRARLSKDAMVCLDNWLHNYLYGTVDKRFNKDLEAYRKMVGEDLQMRTDILGPDG